MPKNNLHYIVVNRNTGKYYIVSGERPIGCDRISLKKLKQNNILFVEIPEIYNKLCKPFHTRFRGTTMIEDLTQKGEKDREVEKKFTYEEDNDIDYLKKLKNISKFKL